MVQCFYLYRLDIRFDKKRRLLIHDLAVVVIPCIFEKIGKYIQRKDIDRSWTRTWHLRALSLP